MYKTTYRIEVLSEEPLEEMSLGAIEYEITMGNCSGSVRLHDTQQLTEYQMAKALMRQGSDPNFLLPDWVQCPYCEGTGKDKSEPLLECWRCGGVGLLSPASLEMFKEVDDGKARTHA